MASIINYLKNYIKTIPVFIFLLLISLIYIIPLLIVFTNSFMSPGELTRNYSAEIDLLEYGFFRQSESQSGQPVSYIRYNLIPERISLEQYNTLLFKTPAYLELFINSIKLTIPIIIFHVIIGSAAGYGFTVWKSRFKEILFFIYLIIMVLPFQATLVSSYIMADMLGILNNHLSIILPWGFGPFAVFIMRQSMKSISINIFEAAQIDGAGHFVRFFRIAAPLSKSGAASLVILSFADCWGMIEHPMIFLNDVSMEPLSVVLYRIGQSNTGLVFAASVFYMLPVVWIFLYGQDYFEKGIMLSAFK